MICTMLDDFIDTSILVLAVKVSVEILRRYRVVTYFLMCAM